MKIRMLALAGVAAVALSAPVHAATEGWYLGLAGGWDEMSGVRATSVPVPSVTGKTGSSDSGIGVVSFGYSWASGLRLEDEIGYTSHSFTGSGTNGFSSGSASGNSSVTSDMLNLVYDIPLGDQWKLSLGGGVGAGDVRIHSTVLNGAATRLDIVKGSHLSFEWQGIAGVAYSLSPDVDLFVDYRYRSNTNDANYATSFTALSPIKVGSINENAVMVGFRWFKIGRAHVRTPVT